MTLPTQVGVYGGGRMGAGIAHSFLIGGTKVVIVESTAETAAAALERVAASLAQAEKRGGLSEPVEAITARLTVVTESAGLAGCSLVIEAVPEILELKRTVLRSVQAVVPDAWLGTNTSSLSLNAIAESLSAPARLIGLHFFNPVPASSLIEIVVGAQTAPELVALARNWTTELGKTPIQVIDSPGFASSRLGVGLALEAMRMVEEGVASAEDIDTAMTLGYKHPMGPLRTTDVVGLDVRLAIAEYLESQLGPRFAPPQILKDLVAEGHLGRKTGRGFYVW
jgi:3-hydroxybutyryl-CoA dehydrogenase